MWFEPRIARTTPTRAAQKVRPSSTAFPLDIVPRVIAAAEWSKLQRGIVQRVRALEAFLADIYGDAEIVRNGVLPRRLITSCAHFHRAAAGLNPPNGVRIHVAGIDVVRDEDGTFRVLENNLRNPSGVSYVMENRQTMARVFPDLFTRQRVRAVGDYSVHLLRALRAAAAPNVADPTVVVLTPGVYKSRVLRALPAGQADGRRAGGGPGPVLSRWT